MGLTMSMSDQAHAVNGSASWILVGVDGGEGGEAAVRYAAEQARRTGAGLKLLHVAPELAYTVAVDPEKAPTGRARRERVLTEAAALARELLGGEDAAERVVTEVAFGGRVERLVEASRACRLVVLGDQHRPVLDRLVTGSVLAGVAAQSRVPVVRVPAGRHASTGAQPTGRVVAAIKDTDDWEGLLDRGLAIAAERDSRLVLLHAWQMPMLYDDLIAARVYENEWEQRARTALQELLARCAPEHKGVEVEIRVEHAQPAKAIVDASRSADLILLARRPLVVALGHLGGTGRSVLRESACPVEVLPPAGLPGLELERDGEFQAAASGAKDQGPLS